MDQDKKPGLTSLPPTREHETGWGICPLEAYQKKCFFDTILLS